MKRTLLSLCLMLLVSGFGFSQTSLLEVGIDKESGLSATVAEMAKANILVISGVADKESLSQIVDACLIEGSAVRVLDMKATSFPDGHVPEEAFYVDDPSHRLTLERISFQPDNIKSIGERAFMNMDCTLVEFTGELISIGKQAFANSTIRSLSRISAYREIGEEAFMNCEYVKELSLDNYIYAPLVIGDRAFAGCRNLAEVSFNMNVTEIGQEAFSGTAVERISLPMSVEEVSLDGMGNLKEIWSLSPVPPVLSACNVSDDIVVKVCPASSSAYSVAEGWSGFLDIKEFTSLPEETEFNGLEFKIVKDDEMLRRVEMHYMDMDIIPALNAKIELFEEGLLTPVAIRPFIWNQDSNCMELYADFDNYKLEKGKSY